MKKLSAFIALIACLSCVCLFGCAGDGDGEYYTTYTVTFNGAGGIAVSGREVQEIHDASEIKAPVYERTGYTFVGWDTDLTTINKKTTVSAEWRANEYKISFANENGEKLFDDKVVTYGEYTGELPTCESKGVGLDFYGWCYGDVTIAEGKRWNIASDVVVVATYGYTLRYDLRMYVSSLKCDCYMLYKGERTVDTRPIKKGESFEDKLFFTGETGNSDWYGDYEVYDLTPEIPDEYSMWRWMVYDVKNSTDKEIKKINITTKSTLTDEIIACADENGVITLSVYLVSHWTDTVRG